MSHTDLLSLDNQLCFPFYAVTRLILRAYQPLLSELDLTYPQYLVLLVLWEQDDLTVNEIASRLVLNTNTLTPVLKRLQKRGLLERDRNPSDERRVQIRLTSSGRSLKERAMAIPVQLTRSLVLPADQLIDLKTRVDQFLAALRAASEETD